MPDRRSIGLPAIAALAVLGVSAALLAGAPNEVAGQTRASAVSVVFAIDNSGSMQGAAGRDPTEQRIDGVRRVIDVLRGFLGERVAERDVRIGAISFGSDAALLSELSSVLEPDLPGRLRSEDRGATDLADALCAAWSVAARQAPPSTSGCALSDDFGAQIQGLPSTPDAERRLVVLITDGTPAPEGAELALDGAPAASSCGTSDLSTIDGDEYLCALRATWATLTAEVETELIVIGLDQRNEWFAATEAYWQRIVGCGGRGEPSCENSVVRSVDAEALADLILRLFPLIDVCDVVTGEEFSCDVPGGLTSVGFQFAGVDALTRTRISDGTSSFDSGEDAANLRATDTSHVWSFEAPRRGLWSAESNGPAAQQIYIRYEPVEFDMTVVAWSDAGLDLRLSARSEVDVPSLTAEPYYLELREQGVPVDNATVHLASDGAGEFSMNVDIARPSFDSSRRYELILFLPLTPRHEVGRAQVGESVPTGSETPTPTPSTSPTPPPPPPRCSIESAWDHTGSAPRHELGLRLGFPLLRFTVSADWSVKFDGVNCDNPVEVTADAEGCDACSASGEGILPLSLTLPAPRDGTSAERETSWYDPSSGREEFASDEVTFQDSLIVRSEPFWAGLLYLGLLALAVVGVSAWAVRTPQPVSDDEIAPIELGIEHRGWPHPLVRARSFVYRPVPADLEGDGQPRVVMLRYFVVGPLVVRGGSATGEGGPTWWQGRPLSESGIRVQRLRVQAPDSYSPF